VTESSERGGRKMKDIKWKAEEERKEGEVEGIGERE
jgi:hypothetical protein